MSLESESPGENGTKKGKKAFDRGPIEPSGMMNGHQVHLDMFR